MDIPANLDALSTEQIRELNAKLMAEIAGKERELQYRQTRIDQLTHELSVIKRQQFGR
ncbi:IS66 family transposase, partial [Paraburkholderia sp. UYCP14C]